MAEPNDIQAIEKISAVVGESQVKITFSNYCIKAQAFLVNRLKRQFEHQKEVSKFISSDNLKLEAEIKNAEQEINSFMLAHQSIKSANVELKKEWQLAKEMTQETIERIQTGEKKYDELWEQCKSRYESIGFVQNWLQATKKKETLEEHINDLDKETEGILQEIKAKNIIISELNKKRIVELAEFFVHERPKTQEKISILRKEIKELNSQVEKLVKTKIVQESLCKDSADSVDASPRKQAQRLSVKIDDGWPNLNKNLTNNVNTLMPKLQLMNIDLDVMSVKLDEIKKSDSSSRNASPMKEFNPETTDKRIVTPNLSMSMSNIGYNENVSLYFQNSANMAGSSDAPGGSNNFNYSKRKLINILEDIKLDKTDTYNIVSKVNMQNLQGVSVITANVKKNNEAAKNKDNANDEEIEELDLTSSNVEQILLPPSGFLDQLRSSQEKKKKVSFELPTSVQEEPLDANKETPSPDTPKDVDGEGEGNITNSPLNESEESFTKIKDMILKKHNLDLSPPFVYGKTNTMLLKNDEVVKSNYFKLSCEEPQPSTSGIHTGTVPQLNEADENEMECDEPVQATDVDNDVDNEVVDNEVVDNEVVDNVEMEGGENCVSNAKEARKQEKNDAKPVAGLLFSHGSLGLPDSLDISINTTGFEDGDADYPQYSCLLLSPKADLPIPSSNENAETEVFSQDVPNFLSGLRKSGLSFFGKMTGSNSNTDTTSAPTGRNNFNFTFGGDDKKNRGGLFNMFN